MTTITSVSPAAGRSPHKRKGWLRKAVIYALCIILLLLFMAPIVFSTLTSVKSPPEAAAVPPTYFPNTFTFANYAKLNMYGAGVWQYLYNSTGVALLTVFGTILLSTLAGFGFSRFDFPAKNLLFVLMLAA